MNKKNISIIILMIIVISTFIIISMVSNQSNKNMADAKKFDWIDIFLANSEISAIFDDGEKIWAGGRDGLIWLDRNTGEILKHEESEIDMTYAGDILRTPDGIIWVGHNNGLTGFNKEGQQRYHFNFEDISKGRINDLDYSGETLSVGTLSGVVQLIKIKDAWQINKTISKQDGLTEDVVNIISTYNNAYLFGAYLSNNKGGISILADGNWQYIGTEEGLPHRDINAILNLPSNDILVGTGHLSRGGLALLTESNNQFSVKKTWQIDNGIPGEKVRWLYLDNHERLWITTESDGLIIVALSELQNENLSGLYLSKDEGLSDNEIKSIIETDDYIWLGGRFGLNRIDINELEKHLINN